MMRGINQGPVLPAIKFIESHMHESINMVEGPNQ